MALKFLLAVMISAKLSAARRRGGDGGGDDEEEDDRRTVLPLRASSSSFSILSRAALMVAKGTVKLSAVGW
jgi:hypothetical protein